MRALALSYDRALGIHFQRQVHFQNRVISGRKPGLTRGKPATQNLSVPAAHAVPDLPYLHLLVRGRYGLLTGLMAGSSEVETHPCLNQQRSAQSLGEAVSQLLVCPHMQNTQLLCPHTLSNSVEMHRNIPHLGRLYWKTQELWSPRCCHTGAAQER